eukprot:gene7326-8531_t
MLHESIESERAKIEKEIRSTLMDIDIICNQCDEPQALATTSMADIKSLLTTYTSFDRIIKNLDMIKQIEETREDRVAKEQCSLSQLFQQLETIAKPIDKVPTNIIKVSITIDSDFVEALKGYIKEIYTMVKPITPPLVPAKEIYVFGGQPNGVSIYDIALNKWRNAGHCYRSKSPSNALKHDKYIYLFGGAFLSHDYQRFDTTTQNWAPTLPITTQQGGGRCISTCFDGKRYMYLIGGQRDERYYMTRVDRFDVLTNSFSEMGYLDRGVSSAFTCVYGNNIYIIGGFSNCMRTVSNITMFNLTTLKQSTFMEVHFHIDLRITSACFDNRDSIYFLVTNNRLYRASLSECNLHEITIVPFKATCNETNMFHYAHQTEPRLYFFERSAGYYYSITSKTWHHIAKPIVSITKCGVTAI